MAVLAKQTMLQQAATIQIFKLLFRSQLMHLLQQLCHIHARMIAEQNNRHSAIQITQHARCIAAAAAIMEDNLLTVQAQRNPAVAVIFIRMRRIHRFKRLLAYNLACPKPRIPFEQIIDGRIKRSRTRLRHIIRSCGPLLIFCKI